MGVMRIEHVACISHGQWTAKVSECTVVALPGAKFSAVWLVLLSTVCHSSPVADIYRYKNGTGMDSKGL